MVILPCLEIFFYDFNYLFTIFIFSFLFLALKRLLDI